jgi:hypothetical protein
VISERGGLPLAVLISAANTPDAVGVLPLLDAVPVNHRRLARRYERLPQHFTAFATIAALLVCHQRLHKITT